MSMSRNQSVLQGVGAAYDAHYPELSYMNMGTEAVGSNLRCELGLEASLFKVSMLQPNIAGTDSSFTTMKLWEASSIPKSILWL